MGIYIIICILQSYCPKHTAVRRSPSRNHLLSSPHKNDMLNEPTQLIQVQESFYKYASGDDLVKEMKLSPKLSGLIYNYWMLKRKVTITHLFVMECCFSVMMFISLLYCLSCSCFASVAAQQTSVISLTH